jgi:predicted permease
MARLLGGDHRIAAGIISVQTVLAALTMPVVSTCLTIALKTTGP